jgi:hypothetical protein
MPDAYGNFKGQGWSRKREAAWDRVFGPRRTAAIGAHADVPVTSEEDDANRDKPPTGR